MTYVKSVISGKMWHGLRLHCRYVLKLGKIGFFFFNGFSVVCKRKNKGNCKIFWSGRTELPLTDIEKDCYGSRLVGGVH